MVYATPVMLLQLYDDIRTVDPLGLVVNTGEYAPHVRSTHSDEHGNHSMSPLLSLSIAAPFLKQRSSS